MYSEENAAAHAKLMVWLESVTPEELFQSCVRAGIYTETGELAAPYRPGEERLTVIMDDMSGDDL